ncbi:Gfo/Idh/MocA family protein [Pseudactinotalea sp. Z1732]|uniref:Gfo/Idh/MocA family protein n=1 Tax=Micrococcales TaxID=85006 RepID=UPI003C7C6365
MEQPIGVGVLGLGSIGTSRARAPKQHSKQARLVASSGGNPERAAEAGWPDADQISPTDISTHPGVDVVAICSPSDQHGVQAIEALQAGKHVVVAKPLALTVAEAERIVALANDGGRVLSVISQRRLEPEYAAVKEMLTSGQLGQVRLATTHVHWWRDADYYAAAPWRSQMDAGGGSVMNQGVHKVVPHGVV